jgi:hypothetical protein
MRGRKPPGAEIVDRLQGSPQAKRRARVILRTLRGELSQVEAARTLGMTPQWFDVQRRRFLQFGLAGLEEKPMGRPRQQVSAEQQRLADLEADVLRLRQELRVGKLREEVAALLGGRAAQKKTRQRRQRPKRR